jgi:glucan phosphoethanolaminetransferase (alkaline phosphatase superfamily)
MNRSIQGKTGKKRVILFRWLFPVIYLAMVLLYVSALVSGAGHTPHTFDRLVSVLIAPCYLLDLIMPKRLVQNAFLAISICAIFSFLSYAVVGWLIDIALQRYRRRRA